MVLNDPIKLGATFTTGKYIKEDESADIIIRFFRKVVAARSYEKMFANGKNFEELGILLTKNLAKGTFRSLRHLDEISNHYLNSINKKLGELTEEELALKEKIRGSKFLFRHQTNIQLAKNNVLKLFSNEKLTKDGLLRDSSTGSPDRVQLSNQDFVFCGVEISDKTVKHPQNTLHQEVDLGPYAYLLDDIHPHGYFTLTDHFFNNIGPWNKHEHQEFFSQFSEVKYEVSRDIHGDKGIKDIPIFNAADMKEALSLHLIDFLRSSKDEGFKKFALSKNLSATHLDRLINFVFQPEFHLPRMVITKEYQEVILSEPSLLDTIFYSNIEKLNEMVKNHEDACLALTIATLLGKKDIINILVYRWSFSKADLPKMNFFLEHKGKNINIGEILSIFEEKHDLLLYFLNKNIIDVNQLSENLHPGNTMLDNAILKECSETITLLKKHNAVTGEELRKKENVNNKQ